jgi:uncharacterized protein
MKNKPFIHQSLIEKTKHYVETIMKDDTSGHDYFHVMRVYETAVQLAKNTRADRLIVELASLLHDVDDPKLVVNVDGSKTRAESFLRGESVDEGIIRHIIDILRTMSYSAYLNGTRVATIEGEIVQDADRLDAIGAIGIARAFAYGGSKHRPIYLGDIDDDSSIAHFYQKLVKLVPLINMRKAKRIARRRMRLMNRFLKAFHKDFAVGMPQVKQ